MDCNRSLFTNSSIGVFPTKTVGSTKVFLISGLGANNRTFYIELSATGAMRQSWRNYNLLMALMNDNRGKSTTTLNGSLLIKLVNTGTANLTNIYRV